MSFKGFKSEIAQRTLSDFMRKPFVLRPAGKAGFEPAAEFTPALT
jgi:hypothetical protein